MIINLVIDYPWYVDFFSLNSYVIEDILEKIYFKKYCNGIKHVINEIIELKELRNN